jgi:hypothetical protein
MAWCHAQEGLPVASGLGHSSPIVWEPLRSKEEERALAVHSHRERDVKQKQGASGGGRDAKSAQLSSVRLSRRPLIGKGSGT